MRWNHRPTSVESAGNGAVFPYVLKSEEYQYPLVASGSAQPAPWKYTKTEYLNAAGNTTSPSYDGYGNPHRIRVTVSNGSGGDTHVVETQNLYSNDTANWILGRLLTARVTHTRSAYSGSANTAPTSLTRVSSFTYEATGSLASETSEPATYLDPISESSVTNPNGTGLWLKKTYLRDGRGNIQSETVTGADLAGARQTTTIYDAAGQLPTTVTNALLHSEQQVWDPRFGAKLSVTGPNGLTTQWQLDSFGRVEAEFAPRTSVWTASNLYWCALSAYCTDSRAVYVLRSSASDGSLSVTEYDRLGREVRGRKVLLYGREAYQDRYFDPLGREFLVTSPYFAGDPPCYTFRRHDVLGRVTYQWTAAKQTQSEADCSNNVLRLYDDQTNPSGGQHTTYQYDEVAAGGAGIITTVSTTQSDAAARTVTKQTNVMGRLRFVRDVLGGTVYATEYDYDPVGNTTWIKDAAGNQTAIGYDVRGFKTAMSDPDMGAWSYVHDALGQLTLQTDAKGQQTVLDYDELGRMKSRVEKTNSTTVESTTNWYYDEVTVGGAKAIGKLTRVVVAANGYAGPTGYQEQYVYDATYGELIDTKRRIDDRWFWITQSYDGQGRLDVLKYPNYGAGDTESAPGPDGSRLKVKHHYNSVGYLSSVSDVASGTVYWTAVSNDAGGAILREELGQRPEHDPYRRPGEWQPDRAHDGCGRRRHGAEPRVRMGPCRQPEGAARPAGQQEGGIRLRRALSPDRGSAVFDGRRQHRRDHRQLHLRRDRQSHQQGRGHRGAHLR